MNPIHIFLALATTFTLLALNESGIHISILQGIDIVVAVDMFYVVFVLTTKQFMEGLFKFRKVLDSSNKTDKV